MRDFLLLYHPLAWAVPQDASDAIFWSNAWPYFERCLPWAPGYFPFSRTEMTGMWPR